jgi:AraC-like DNA-binding protein
LETQIYSGRVIGGPPEPRALVRKAAIQITPGEFPYSAPPVFTVGIHLMAPRDVWFERNSEHFEGRILPGDITCIPAGENGVFRVWQPGVFNHLHIDLAFVQQTYADLHVGLGIDNRWPFRDPLIEQIMRAATSGGSRLLLESAAVLILERLAQVPVCETVRGSAPRIRLAMEYMLSNLARAVSLAELSEVSGLSPSQFLRVFKTTTNLSPHRYLTQARLAHARELLADSARPLAQVALDAGFSSQSHLTWAFHNYYGTTPAVFRKASAPASRSHTEVIVDCDDIPRDQEPL